MRSGSRRQDHAIVVVASTAILSVLINLVALKYGITIVFQNIYYIPIVFASYFYKKRGLIFSVFLSAIYLTSVLATTEGMETIFLAFVRVLIFLFVSAIVTYLSLQISREKERYQAVFTSSESGIFLYELETGAIREANRRFTEITGRYPEEGGPLHLQEIFADAVSERIIPSLRQGGHLTREEVGLKRGDGTEITALLSCSPIGSSLAACTLVDITEMRRMQEEIAFNARRLGLIKEVLNLSVSSFSLEQFLQVFLGKVIEAMKLRAGVVYILDVKTGKPERSCAQGFPEGCNPELELMDAAKSMIMESVQQKAAVFGTLPKAIPCIGDDPNPGIGIMPIVMEVGVIGIVVFVARRGIQIPQDDRRILESLGMEIGWSVIKERLQEELNHLRLKQEEAMAELKSAHEQLAKAHEEANLYLDIMAHDINNANTAALGYGQLLADILQEKERELARKMLLMVQQSVEIIKNVSTIRMLHERKEPLKPVSLDQVIRGEIAHYPDTGIVYEGTGAMVIADDLLGEVLNNLIGNSRKFGGEHVRIEIKAEEKGDLVEISVSDTGPGIPDDMKPEIFNRFRKGKSKKSGKGLGLFISRMLVERYGGMIWAEDRVPGAPEKGAVVKFTLQKAAI